jgi:parallel beta-helix repeat protein
MRNKTRALVEMTIGLVVLAGTVQAATFINTCPFVITSPGVYLLSADLACPGGGGAAVGITITSSHVTLKLEGHTIRSLAPMGFAISTTETAVTDVHILGPGRISTSSPTSIFVTGVSLGRVTDSEVSGITVQGTTVGIVADNTTGLTFTKNTLAGGTVGIDAINLTSSTISENVASECTTGIDISGGATGPPVMLSRNTVNGNRNTGVSIGPGVVRAQNNIISGNSTVGIYVTGATALEITNNTVLANGTYDLIDSDPDCRGTVWSSNTFFVANRSCIH